jgi:hypothetical protein
VIETKPSDLIPPILPKIRGSGLNKGQKNSLIAKLKVALKKLQNGQTDVPCMLLKAFINEVNAYIKTNKLSESDGQSWIAMAEKAMAKIGCD